jgi:hypothetical protein
LAEHVVSKPLPPLSQTYCPPVTQWLPFLMSARNGAMKRKPGSHGLGMYVVASHEGLISVKALIV